MLVRGGGAFRAVGGCLRLGSPSSTSALTSFLFCPVLLRRLWRVVGWVGILLDAISGVWRARCGSGVTPRHDDDPFIVLTVSIGADVWVESSIMTGVYECWCSSTLHIGWGLCDSLCLVLLCGGRYGLGVGFFSLFWDRVWADRTGEGSSEGRKRVVV